MNTADQNAPAPRLEASACADLARGRRLEWMVANGRGGYSMATIHQMLTRRYHGLLVAAIEPPVERFVLLAKLEATIVIDGLTYELATNDYVEAVHPQGYKLLESFAFAPFPTWRWRAGNALVEQTLCMVAGEDTTYVRYRLLEGPPSVQLTVRPLCTSRHFHTLRRYQDMGPPTVESGDELIALSWSGRLPSWTLSFNGVFRSRPDWYYQFVLALEAERGYDSSQDLFMPGVITAPLRREDPVGVVFAASTAGRSWKDWAAAFEQMDARSRPTLPDALSNDPLAVALARAAGDFLVGRGESGKTVIAGYPWFGDWGRDTFISLPGLCLVTGRLATAREIIETMGEYVDQGMIPNRFPDFGQPPSYNTADASLWYLHAIERYLTWSGDWDWLLDRMYRVVCGIIEAHERGTRHGIGLAPDGLLAAGESGFALTWMDARVFDRAVTPRIGKPVEINALWYNALEVAASFAERAGDAARAGRWRNLAARARAAFNERFWNGESACLYDLVDVDGVPGAVDPSLRPNQLLGLALSHVVLDESRWRPVVERCEQHLVTPVGLRSLAPRDPNYRGRYQGNMVQRDEAYHQGTVWPWLLGPFVTAWVRAMGSTPRARKSARRFLEGLGDHLLDAGIGSVSEVADGDPPHTPGGCPWQAWSVAEPLRALAEDILQARGAPRRHESAARSTAPVA